MDETERAGCLRRRGRRKRREGEARKTKDEREKTREKGGERRETGGGTHRCKLISKKPEKEGNVRSFVEGERTVFNGQRRGEDSEG